MRFTHAKGREGAIALLVAVALTTAACTRDDPAAPQPPATSDAAAPRDPWRRARERGIDYRAIGQEPGWFLEIDDGESMRLVYDYGERSLTTPAFPPVRTSGRTTYSAMAGAHTLTVVVEHRPCQDVMSGEGFPHTVTVSITARELRGCGRSLRD